MDRTFIKNLLVRGIVGINPEERANRQDILINISMYSDTREAATSDDVRDAVNYRSVAKAVIAHVESGEPKLVERLADELVDLCFATERGIEMVELTVEKPGAVRFAESVGVTISRTREAHEGNRPGNIS